MIRRAIDGKSTSRSNGSCPEPAPLPIVIEYAATAAQWTGVIVGAFIAGVRR